MHFVVVLTCPDPIETAASRIAARLELAPYEARTRVSGQLPRIVTVLADPAAARAAVADLGLDGFAARVLPAAAVEHDDDRDIVTSLAFAPASIEATLRDGRQRAIAYDAISGVIHGVRSSFSSITSEQVEKKFSATKAILTSGLMTQSATTRTTTATTESREAFAYIYENAQGPPLALYERQVNYAFLGAGKQPSSMANFNATLAEVTRRAPAARIDARLLRPAATGFMPLAPRGRDAGTWKVDVAVALVLLGMQRDR